MKQSIDIAINGMMCAACVRRVEKSMTKLAGVDLANVNLATESARVTFDDEQIQANTICEAINKAGYQSQLIQSIEQQVEQLASQRQDSAIDKKKQFLWAFLFSLPLVIIEMGGHLIPAWHDFLSHSGFAAYNPYVQFLLCSLVLLFPGRDFFRLGFKALFKLAPDMNSLVALGAGSAWFYSTVNTFFLPSQRSPILYFEAAAVVLSLVLLGRYLELKSKGQTGQAISRLLALQTNVAHKLVDEQLLDIAIDQVQVGDVLWVKAGEKIPLDGLVISGHAIVDESMISGEPIPLDKQEGDTITAGTLNLSGTISMQVKANSQHTVLANIIQMVQNAQGAKLPIQHVLDKITAYVVPVVGVIAIISFIVWLFLGPEPSFANALIAAVSVLIIACPCAMGLAVPVSTMVAIGRATEHGFLFRQAQAMQLLRNIKAVAFDKTGTLTQGRPELIDLLLLQPIDADALLCDLASIEQRSEHPLAKAIVQKALDKNLRLLPLTQFESAVGLGIKAQLDNRHYVVGAADFIQSQGIDISFVQNRVDTLSAQGKTLVYIANEQGLVALAVLADPLKDSAKPLIASLQKQGIKVIMISGDQHLTVKAVANELGIDEFYARCSPQQKTQMIEQLKAQYGLLAFVGDGINDAPALASADVSMAFNNGTDIAIETADVVLMHSDLHKVAQAIELSKQCFKNIYQNLFWAFAYNVILIPVAAGLFYPYFGWRLSPMLGAMTMALSSVFVVCNALRLKLIKI